MAQQESNSVIRNIVFDMGGVLIQWTPELVMNDCGCTEEEKKLFRKEIFGEKIWTALDGGTVTNEEAVENILCRVGEQYRKSVTEICCNWWNHPLHEMPGMRDLIETLHRNGYQLYILSNAEVHQQEYYHQLPGGEYFTGVLTSALEKKIKPCPSIYETFLKKFHLKAEECFFTDDRAANCYMAEQSGFVSEVFHDTEDLKKKMQDHNIRI